jgi:hypothetical protein
LRGKKCVPLGCGPRTEAFLHQRPNLCDVLIAWACGELLRRTIPAGIQGDLRLTAEPPQGLPGIGVEQQGKVEWDIRRYRSLI